MWICQVHKTLGLFQFDPSVLSSVLVDCSYCQVKRFDLDLLSWTLSELTVDPQNFEEQYFRCKTRMIGKRVSIDVQHVP
jgi:hypothetical protein